MKGPAFLLKLGNGDVPLTYHTVAGFRVGEEHISEGGGYSVVATGVMLGSTAESEVRAHAFSGTTPDCELSFEDGHKVHGRFLIQRLDYAGDWNGERSYTIALTRLPETTNAARTGAPEKDTPDA